MDLTGWQAIDIFLFKNGQGASPPRKYHLTAEELDLWNSTLNFLANSQYGSKISSIELYSLDGQKLTCPMQLQNGKSYVAVQDNDTFKPDGYKRYIMKATRSWEKRQSKSNSDEGQINLITDDSVKNDIEPIQNKKQDEDVQTNTKKYINIDIQNLYNSNQEPINSENINNEHNHLNNSSESFTDYQIKFDNVDTAVNDKGNIWCRTIEIYNSSIKYKVPKVLIKPNVAKSDNLSKQAPNCHRLGAKGSPKAKIIVNHKILNKTKSPIAKRRKGTSTASNSPINSTRKLKSPSPVRRKPNNKSIFSQHNKNVLPGTVDIKRAHNSVERPNDINVISNNVTGSTASTYENVKGVGSNAKNNEINNIERENKEINKSENIPHQNENPNVPEENMKFIDSERRNNKKKANDLDKRIVKNVYSKPHEIRKVNDNSLTSKPDVESNYAEDTPKRITTSDESRSRSLKKPLDINRNSPRRSRSPKKPPDNNRNSPSRSQSPKIPFDNNHTIRKSPLGIKNKNRTSNDFSPSDDPRRYEFKSNLKKPLDSLTKYPVISQKHENDKLKRISKQVSTMPKDIRVIRFPNKRDMLASENMSNNRNISGNDGVPQGDLNKSKIVPSSFKGDHIVDKQNPTTSEGTEMENDSERENNNKYENNKLKNVSEKDPTKSKDIKSKRLRENDTVASENVLNNRNSTGNNGIIQEDLNRTNTIPPSFKGDQFQDNNNNRKSTTSEGINIENNSVRKNKQNRIRELLPNIADERVQLDEDQNHGNLKNKNEITTFVKSGDIFRLKVNLSGKDVEGYITVNKKNADESGKDDIIPLNKSSQTNLNIIFKERSLTEVKTDIKDVPKLINEEINTNKTPNVIIVQCTCCESFNVEELKTIIPSALPEYEKDLNKQCAVLIPTNEVCQQNPETQCKVSKDVQVDNVDYEGHELEDKCKCVMEVAENVNECVQTEPDELIASEVNTDKPNEFVDASTQMDCIDTLLMPVRHEDGHYTFRLPPLYLVKNIYD